MTRSFTPVGLVALPRMDAAQAVKLAQLLEAAATDAGGKTIELPRSLEGAVAQLGTHRAALQSAIAAAAPVGTAAGLRLADRLEDDAVTALHDLLAAWARLSDELPGGRLAAHAYERLFGDGGLEFLSLPVKQEWEVVEAKLELIKKEKLRPALAKLGAAPILDYLASVHTDYGEATGMTRIISSTANPPAVREKQGLLLDAIRAYVLRVAASVERGQPATKLLADRLLRPLSQWEAQAEGRRRGRPTGHSGAGA
jgi:hypothetical protein